MLQIAIVDIINSIIKNNPEVCPFVADVSTSTPDRIIEAISKFFVLSGFLKANNS